MRCCVEHTFEIRVGFFRIAPTSPGMNQSGWTELNPDMPFRDTGLSFQKFQLGIGGTCGNNTMAGGVGFDPPAG